MTVKRIAITLTSDTLDKLECICNQLNVSKSQFISLVLHSVLTGSIDQSFLDFINSFSSEQ